MLPDIYQLIEQARQAGTSEAAIIPPSAIVAEEHLAEFCRPEGCDNFGKGLSCPPHVEGVEWFRRLQQKANHALVLRIDTHLKTLLSDDRRRLMQQLHAIVAKLELQAKDMGFPHSRGFAGGSCFQLFCKEHESCSGLTGRKVCRYPETARPSMSGYGINVEKMLHSAGWTDTRISTRGDDENDEMAWVAGLVMICRN